MQHFGQRLRALIARRSITPEEFWADFGISRATYFNWLKRSEPPPSKKHQDELVTYFGMSPSYILQGIPDGLDASKIGVEKIGVEEAATDDDSAAQLTESIRHHHEELLLAAHGNLSRLGWISEQMRQHLAIPASWARPANPNLVRIVPKTATNQQRPPTASPQARSA